MILSDGKIRLRAPEPEDLDVLFNMENDTKLWLVSGNALPYSRYQLKKYIEESAHDFYSDRQIRFMIVLEFDANAIGSVDLTCIDPYNGRAEIGIALLDSFRKKGIASAAMKILFDYSKNVLHIHQLYCHVPAENAESIKLFSSNGFAESGRLKDWLYGNEAYEDVILMQKFF